MKSKLFGLLVVLFAINLSVNAQTAAPQLGKNNIREVVAAMTLHEKAKLVTGMGVDLSAMLSTSKEDSIKMAPIVANLHLPPNDPADANVPAKVPSAAGRTHAIDRLGIPSITVSDGPAGVRISPHRSDMPDKTFFATAFPVGTLLASTWDTAIVKAVGVAFGSEAHDYGIDVMLGPALNIHRNPLGGRNFEYYSEDPLVSGKIAAAMVNGMQSSGVGTSIKHFVANNQETNRNSVNTIVSERALREIYLKGFEITVKDSHPWTIMSSYNLLNGTYTSESSDLLTTILHEDWGYKGMVMTDWFGGKDAVAQMKAGNDLLMPGNMTQSKSIEDAVNAGTLDVKLLDRNVAKILHMILLSPEFNKYKYSNAPDIKAHAQVSRMAATEGMILLKNEKQSLPLVAGNKIALFGNTSYEPIVGGTGSGAVNNEYTVSLFTGLTNAGFAPDAGLSGAYASYIADLKAKKPKEIPFFSPPFIMPELTTDAQKMAQMAAGDDIAIITIGRNGGEGKDREMAGDYQLTQVEKDLISGVADAFHAKGKKAVVVLNIGGVIEMASWSKKVDGILLAWQPGMEGGNAIVDVLGGKVNPSGKLATTFPRDYPDVPSAINFPGKELPNDGKPIIREMQGRPAEVTYAEGIYIGYRYYNTFNVKPTYEFGYGLSYTKFAYSDLKLSGTSFGDHFTASVTITNTGKVAGKEVVQLYLSAPHQMMDKPESELKGFAKTNLLQPRQSQTITFNLTSSDLASFDSNTSSWVAEAGKYQVKIGASCTNILLNASFNLDNAVTASKVHKALVPQVPIHELKSPASK